MRRRKWWGTFSFRALAGELTVGGGYAVGVDSGWGISGLPLLSIYDATALRTDMVEEEEEER